jgi:hypothetical protein
MVIKKLMMKTTKLPHYLHLIKGKGFMMMTLADAHQYALENNADVWNVHKSIDLKPEYFDIEEAVKSTITTKSTINYPNCKT